MPAFQADLVVKNSDGYPIALIEIKNVSDLSRDIATEIHHNMLERGLPKHVPYFLLVSQDKGYLWKDGHRENLDVSPNYEFPMDTVIKRYMSGDFSRRLYRESLEFLVFQWLNNLATRDHVEKEEPEKTLNISGFSDSIKGATVLFEKVG